MFDLWGGRKFRSGWSKNIEKYLYPMFPYTKKYTKFESDIQNNDTLYKLTRQYQKAFELFEKFRKHEETQKTLFYFVVCINCIIPIL